MIRVNINETFPITVALVDETAGVMASGRSIHYDFRLHPNDQPLSPPIAGYLVESVAEDGVYSKSFSLTDPGHYIVYTSCSGFSSGAEDVIVEEDNLVQLVKQNRHYNISVEDVIRENAVATASQTTRNVSVGNTDYIINKIKLDADLDWSTPTTVSGSIYAWYRTLEDDIPYKMGGPA